MKREIKANTSTVRVSTSLDSDQTALFNPERCPACGKHFAIAAGCHKICRCGYEEGCGD